MQDTYLELDNDRFVLGIPIAKVNAEQRIVEGFATLDNIDKAGDVLDADASKRAFQKWAGNIREMHQKKAVGRKVSWESKPYTDPETGETYNGIWVAARISKGAEDTWQKVLDGTLSGFSVGGAIHEKEKEMRKGAGGYDQQVWRVTNYSLGELSLVDNPCNGLANVSLVKSMDGELTASEELDEFEKAADDSGDKSVSKSKAPYGDVEYADPGYQSDGKKRYPVDTKEHALAAWDYINQTDNAHLYKPGDLSKVKSKIQAACKRFGIETAEKMVEDGNLIKSEISDKLDSDDDSNLITPVVDALKAWQASEVKDGDQGDVRLTASLLQRLSWRVQYGDGTDLSDLEAQLDGDEDASYIKSVIDALVAWQKDEVDNGGDQSDVDLISDLLQEIGWRIRSGDNPDGFVDVDDDMDKAIDSILDMYKDGDGDGDTDSSDGDGDSGPIAAYPAQELAHAVRHLSNFRHAAKKHGHKDMVAAADQAIGHLHAMHSSAQEKSQLAKLHDKPENDISEGMDLTEPEQSVLRKFMNFLAGKPAASQEANIESEDSEMDEKMLKEAVESAVESLVKSSDDKFNQVADSLAKVGEALEKVASTEKLEEMTKSFTETLDELKARIEAVETSGAMQKSAEDAGTAGTEKLEKSAGGLWAGSLVPEFAMKRIAEGR